MSTDREERKDRRIDAVTDLDDKDMARDVLMMHKQFCSSYELAERESANKLLRDTLHRIQEEEAKLHEQLFHLMQQRGWYRTATAAQQAIEEEIIRWEQAQIREPELQQP